MEFKNKIISRENFFLVLLQRLFKEYKILLEQLCSVKPLKIVEILELSSMPGASKFLMHNTNKNTFLQISAADIISQGYQLHDFNDFHADMIRHATHGKLLDFLHLTEKEPAYKIVSKKMQRDTRQYLFTIESADKNCFIRSANELSQDKNLLANLNIHDIYDIDYTLGCGSILKEKTALLLAENSF